MKNYILLFVFLFISQLFAQATQRSIADALDNQGRIKHGVSGSFNGNGYKLSYGANNEPILKKGAPNQIQSISWSSMGQMPGVNDVVEAVAIDAAGNVYVGGIFGWPNSRLAKWDGSTWSSMGDFNGGVEAIAIRGSDIYVGGGFIDIDGNTTLRKIAKWNGTSWSALGSNFTGVYVTAVYDIAFKDSSIYVGGSFSITLDDFSQTTNIARWDGSVWSEVGGGVNGLRIRDLAIDTGGNVYAGGNFHTAGGSPATNIAKWNGVSWSTLGSGLNNDVYTIAVDASGNVYAGGTFTQAGGVSASRLAVWNGSTWSEFGGGIGTSVVYSILIDGTDIYVGGDFQSAGGNAIEEIAKWNGTSWSSLGLGISSSYVSSIAIYGTNLYVGGSFSVAGNVVAYNVAKWNGSVWIPMGGGPTNTGGISGEVFAIAVNGTDVYFGGSFIQAGGISTNGIAKWDGNNWSALGNGVNGYVKTIIANGAYIYAGGTFTTAGGSPASRIARWSIPNEIQPLGGWDALVDGIYDGVNAEVRAMVLNSNDGYIYVGGFFTEAAGKSANYIAKWDGTSWSAVNYSDALNWYVYSLAVNNAGDLFVGGDFSQAGGVAANRIAKWDGTSWSALGTGLGGAVYALATSGNDLYAGGQFYFGGGTSYGIAKWNGSNWSALSYGVGGDCYAIIASGGYVYAGGNFGYVYLNADGSSSLSVNNIARWDGTSWANVGNGTIGAVNALTISSSEGVAYVGGAFYVVDGNIGSGYASKFTDSQNALPVELLSFTALLNNENVALNWQTATEVNNYGFEIERASFQKNGTTPVQEDWGKIGFVEGHGNSNSPKEYSFTDKNLPSGKIEYRLKQIDTDGQFEYSDVVEVNISFPIKFELSQNYPNPFNPSTTIKYSIPSAVGTGNIPSVQLNVYDVLGREIATLVNEDKSPGNYSVTFNASKLSSGIYFYQLKAGSFVDLKKMILMK